MTQIDLVTGLLGAGKTTFLLRYAQACLDRGEHIAILENDFGAVNVDVALLRGLKSDRCQIEMVSGGGDSDCHRRRFKTQLIALGMQHLDRVIVEPSGIFDMDEFFDTLYTSPLDRWFTIGSILTILDATQEDDLSPQMAYLFASEAACSGKLILSKVSDDPDGDRDRVLARLNAALADIACDRQFTERDVLAKPWDDLTAADLDALAHASYRGARYVKRYSIDALRAGVHYFMHIAIPEAQIVPLVTDMLHDPAYGRVYRIKGCLPAADGGRLKLNAVGETVALDPIPEGQAVLIVIGDDLDFPRLDSAFRKVNTDPEYVSI